MHNQNESMLVGVLNLKEAMLQSVDVEQGDIKMFDIMTSASKTSLHLTYVGLVMKEL